jgi:hypothetical protein
LILRLEQKNRLSPAMPIPSYQTSGIQRNPLILQSLGLMT